jgi:DNA-binding NtrC family response regulator
MSLLRRIVVISKEVEVQQLARQIGHEIFVADDLAEALDIVVTVSPDLIIFDGTFNPIYVQEFIRETDKNSLNIPVVVVGSDENDPKLASQFIQIGIYDYLQPKQRYDKLTQIANRIRNESENDAADTNTSNFFVDECAEAVCMVGRSKAFVKTLGMIRLVAASQCNPVLIIGETGTGKELAAKAIHTLRHPNEQFVAVNCAALTANLLESELFGHVKGSFTGAERDKIGLLELAGSGTIFLDEISEMPLDLQAKLLRVLQEKTFRKVGGTKSITSSATIIASSNRNLYKEMKAHRFRRDLYYRLNICPVIIAPLKSPDRREDIPLLAEYFIKTSSICPEKNNRITSLTKYALEALQKHDWPGNVRELSNVIERAILLETTAKIGLSSIVLEPIEYKHPSEDLPSEHFGQAGLPAWRGQFPSQQTDEKDFSLAKAERELVIRALRETGWQKTQAADLLGITRTTLYAKVKQYNIKKDSSASANPSGHITDSLRGHVSSPISAQPVTAN